MLDLASKMQLGCCRRDLLLLVKLVLLLAGPWSFNSGVPAHTGWPATTSQSRHSSRSPRTGADGAPSSSSFVILAAAAPTTTLEGGKPLPTALMPLSGDENGKRYATLPRFLFSRALSPFAATVNLQGCWGLDAL